jgi:glyoxylase-like metal-dependent hydrolase (beta-lactamase superfamily II)
MLDPNKEIARKRARDIPEVAAMRADMEPVPESRIKFIQEGETFDLGNGQKLTAYLTPGHQPSGTVFYDHKHKGLFINDLTGNTFLDADSQYPLSPSGSDHQKCIDSLNRLMPLELKYLYLGHYGMTDQPYLIMKKAISNMQNLLDMGKEYVKAGKSEQIAGKMLEMLEPELKKLGAARGEKFYKYATGNHQRIQSQSFTRYCIEHFS